MIMIHTLAYEYDHMNFVTKLPFVLFHSFDNFTFIIKYGKQIKLSGRVQAIDWWCKTSFSLTMTGKVDSVGNR